MYVRCDSARQEPAHFTARDAVATPALRPAIGNARPSRSLPFLWGGGRDRVASGPVIPSSAVRAAWPRSRSATGRPLPWSARRVRFRRRCTVAER